MATSSEDKENETENKNVETEEDDGVTNLAEVWHSSNERELNDNDIEESFQTSILQFFGVDG